MKKCLIKVRVHGQWQLVTALVGSEPDADAYVSPAQLRHMGARQRDEDTFDLGHGQATFSGEIDLDTGTELFLVDFHCWQRP